MLPTVLISNNFRRKQQYSTAVCLKNTDNAIQRTKVPAPKYSLYHRFQTVPPFMCTYFDFYNEKLSSTT
jgi:hypothetical protein